MSAALEILFYLLMYATAFLNGWTMCLNNETGKRLRDMRAEWQERSKGDGDE